MSTLAPPQMPEAPPIRTAPAAPPPAPKADKTKNLVIILLAVALLVGAVAAFIVVGNNDQGPTVTVQPAEPQAPAEPSQPAQTAPVGPTDAHLAAMAVIRYMPDYLSGSQMNQYCSLATQISPAQAATTTDGDPGTLGYRIRQTADKYGVTTTALFAEYIQHC